MTTRCPPDAGEHRAMPPPTHPVHLLGMGQVLRDSRPKSVVPEHIGDYANLYAALCAPGHKHVPFEAGINAIAMCGAADGRRVPAILVALVVASLPKHARERLGLR